MFTGIVEYTAKIIQNTGHTLVLERPATFDDVKLGSSIAVAGVCLSIVELTDHSMRFDVIDETLAKTTLGSLKVGDLVNVERAMKADARLDGHVVQGHIEGVGEVTSDERRVKSGMLSVRIPQQLLASIVPKGSIALDGVSLTVASLDEDICTVALIPHTLAHTALGTLKEGDRVNVETDILQRTYAHR